ncbi:MAG: T9SS type A sorting domain-containing protein [Crocinitomicaceae bacterium]|nr:T9SS type A sorting domain-containing protein [Crocinitomicaceae bacterium]
MKKSLLTIISIGIMMLSFGQSVVVVGVSPAAIQGSYTFAVQTDQNWPRYAESQFAPESENWGLSMNFAVPGTFIKDTLVLVNDGTPGNNTTNVGNPLSEEGCNPSPANAYAGKIAILRRNTCAFTAKAKYAQDAGAIAVIVVDNIDDDNLENNYMSAAADDVNGPLVTIPVVRISLTDGNRLIDEMANGPVVMFIGNKTAAFPYDLAMTTDLVATPLYSGVHSLLSQNASEFNFDLGLRVYNYGSADIVGGTANVKITGPSTVVYDETVSFDLTGATSAAIDSVDIFPGETLSFPNFSLATYPEGEYLLEYTLDPGATDQFPSDNYFSVKFNINSSKIAHGQLDPTTLKPIVNSYVMPSESNGATEEVRYCSAFENPNASRLGVVGVEASVALATTATPGTLSDHSIFFDVYEWNDVFTYPSATFAQTDINPTYSGEYAFTGVADTEAVYIQFPTPLYLVDNQKYLFCFSHFGLPLRFGYDRSVNLNVASQLLEQLPNPVYVTPGNGWYASGFGFDLTPAIGLHAVDADIAKLENLVSMNAGAFPNPASDNVTISIPNDGKATISINDLTGRTVANHNVEFVSNNTTINIADLTPGIYVFNVVYDNGAKSTFNVVKK